MEYLGEVFHYACELLNWIFARMLIYEWRVYGAGTTVWLKLDSDQLDNKIKTTTPYRRLKMFLSREMNTANTCLLSNSMPPTTGFCLIVLSDGLNILTHCVLVTPNDVRYFSEHCFLPRVRHQNIVGANWSLGDTFQWHLNHSCWHRRQYIQKCRLQNCSHIVHVAMC